MSHYHCEIVMPKVEDVNSAIQQIMEPFSENGDDVRNGFWDFFVIGGRFAGAKLQASCDPEKLSKFHEALKSSGITVSGLQCGKQELSPANQIPMVDKMWHEFFPELPDGPCPLFSHSNNQYDANSLLPNDICDLRVIPLSLKFDRIIFAGQKYESDELEATSMLATSIWNGVNHQDTNWDGSFSSAIELFKKHSECYRDEYRERITPREDWLVVTVDYHS